MAHLLLPTFLVSSDVCSSPTCPCKSLYTVSFNLNLFLPLFPSCFLFAGSFYSTQYLSRTKRYYNTKFATAGDWRWFLPWSLPFRSFFQAADSSSGDRGAGRHNSNPPASAEVVLIWLTGTANSNSGNEVCWTLVWAAQVYCASESTDKTLRGRWTWLCVPTDLRSRAIVHLGAVNTSLCIPCSHY